MKLLFVTVFLIFTYTNSCAYENFNDFIKRKDSISVSDFLRWSTYLTEEKGIDNPFSDIPSQIVDNQSLMSMFISTELDTLYLKIEQLKYNNFRLIDTPRRNIFQSKEFYQLMAWNSEELIYIDDQGNNLLTMVNSTPQALRKNIPDFFTLIEEWDQENFDYHKTDHIAAPISYKAPSTIIRITFKDWHFEIDSFSFINLFFNKKVMKNYYNNAAYEMPYLMNYNAIIEDILFYRHFTGINSDYTPKEREFRLKYINRQREYRKEHNINIGTLTVY